MKFISITAIIVIIFLFGTLAGLAMSENFVTGLTIEQPSTPYYTSAEQESPSDHIKESQIKVYSDKVEIFIPDRTISWSRYADSNSMDPFLDAEANGIEIVPKSPTDIQKGDIVSYQYNNDIIVHRVKEIGYDKKGWYAVTKGDNNPIKDPYKVRFPQVKYILVAIIY